MKDEIFPKLVREAVLAGATVEFWFAEGAKTPAEAYERGFRRVGNIISATPQLETQDIETFGSFRGQRRLIKHTETQRRRSYQLDNNTLDLEALTIDYRGEKADAFAQAEYDAAEVDDFVFDAENPSQKNRGYPLLDEGVRVRQVETVTLMDDTTPLEEGTDFVVDKVHGMIFFLTEQTSAITPTVTGAAIDEESALYEHAFTPDQVQSREGYGSIYIYDQCDENSIHHRHEDFSCLIRPGERTQLDQDTEEARTQLVVEQTQDPGKVFIRRNVSPDA